MAIIDRIDHDAIIDPIIKNSKRKMILIDYKSINAYTMTKADSHPIMPIKSMG